MKNADYPAMPIGNGEQRISNVNHAAMGLTKREQIAAMAMQGLCADLTASEAEGYTITPDIVATDAVALADALLAALEKAP